MKFEKGDAEFLMQLEQDGIWRLSEHATDMLERIRDAITAQEQAAQDKEPTGHTTGHTPCTNCGYCIECGDCAELGCGRNADKEPTKEDKMEKPYAMVPLGPGPNGELVKVEFGQELQFSDNGTYWYKDSFLSFDDTDTHKFQGLSRAWYKQARLPQPKPPKPPQRPKIEIDEPVELKNICALGEWHKGHFAGWVNGLPTAWIGGKTSHTTMGRYGWSYVKTQDGTIWPPEEGE
jgi:hypothetical protein